MRGGPAPKVQGRSKLEHVGVTTTVTATGELLPTVVTHRGKEESAEKKEMSPFANFLFNRNGWPDEASWLAWSNVIIEYMDNNDLEDLYVFADGDPLHYDPVVIEKFAHRRVYLIILPPGCTAYLQPLDVGFFGPLKVAIYALAEKKHETVTAANFIKYFDAVTRNADGSTQERWAHVIRRSFEKSGLFPVNRVAIPESAFGPSDAVLGLTPATYTPPKITPEIEAKLSAAIRAEISKPSLDYLARRAKESAKAAGYLAGEHVLSGEAACLAGLRKEKDAADKKAAVASRKLERKENALAKIASKAAAAAAREAKRAAKKAPKAAKPAKLGAGKETTSSGRKIVKKLRVSL